MVEVVNLRAGIGVIGFLFLIHFTTFFILLACTVDVVVVCLGFLNSADIKEKGLKLFSGSLKTFIVLLLRFNPFNDFKATNGEGEVFSKKGT